jgi:hypothetical protein
MTTIASARRDWEQGYRAFVAQAGDPRVGDRLHAQAEVLTDEIRRRIGSTFTLEELTDVYLSSERWGREALGERAPRSGWERTLSLALDAAFHLYSRGAQDFVP